MKKIIAVGIVGAIASGFFMFHLASAATEAELLEQLGQDELRAGWLEAQILQSGADKQALLEELGILQADVMRLRDALAALEPAAAPTTPTLDTARPTITVWDVQPRATGVPLAISWTVKDTGGSYVNRVEVNRAPANGTACADSDKSGCVWTTIASVTASALLNDWVGHVTDIPSVGSYFYGIHVVDGGGNRTTESSPISVVPPACTYSYSAWGECQPNKSQTHTVISAIPAGCAGTPVISQPCTYVPPSQSGAAASTQSEAVLQKLGTDNTKTAVLTGNTLPLHWASWGSGEFSRKFRTCKVSGIDTTSHRLDPVNTDPTRRVQPRGDENAPAETGHQYYYSVNCTSNLFGAPSSVPGGGSVDGGGVPVLAGFDDIKYTSSDKLFNEGLPGAPAAPKPKYREL